MQDESSQGKTLPKEPRPSDQIGRRQILKWLGVGALGLAPVPIVPALLRSTLTGDSPRRSGQEEPARTDSGRLRRWAMVIDLRYCDGCQGIGKPPQCTQACIEGRFVPEPMEWIQVYEGELSGGGTQFIPAPCLNCQNAPCVNVCPVAATFHTPEGVVLIDQDRCIGCRICMAACPYDRRFFNWGNAPIPPEALLADYSPEHQSPAKKGTVMKCDFCPDVARAGRLPFCVQGCPQRALYYGDLEEDIATNGRRLIQLSWFLSDKAAYRLKEDLGTKPRVYYIPGHGELVGRNPFDEGRLPTEWPWIERAEGAKTWRR